jgi:hypothetical protein
MLLHVGMMLPLIALVSVSAAANTILFADDFDAEAGSGDGPSGQSGLDYDGFQKWTVSAGTVDIILDGDFATPCADSGKCVDLDGSASDAGILTSSLLSFDPGVYTLEFKLGGVSTAFTSGSAKADNIVDVSIGALFSDTYTIEWGAAFQTFTVDITVASATSASLVFDNRGGDNFGAMLDDVAVLNVPEPGTALLIGVGLAALAFPRRRVAA